MYLIPQPQKMNVKGQNYILRYDTRIIVNNDLGMKEVNYAKILKDNILENIGFSLSITKSDQAEDGIYLTISSDLNQAEYRLAIAEKSIVITGGSSEGLLYGVQTLRQVIENHGAVLPCLIIEDYPEIPNRGFYHDVTRGRIPTLATLKAMADKMSYYKLNQLQLYVEHSFLFRDFSEVWRDDTPLTAEEIIELDSYCQSLNIELVPSIASFGHLYKVLKTKTYSHLCELENSDKEEFSFVNRMLHHTVDVTNEESFAMIKRMLHEYLPLFSSKQFNICSDETFDLGKGKSKKLADEVGTNRIYVDFLKKLCEFIKSQGKSPMFWGDIIIEQPELIHELPKDVVCLNWNYDTEVTDSNVKKLYDTGVTQYICPGVHGWNHLINRLEYAYINISSMCNFAHQYKAAGVLNTDWGDYGHICHAEFSTTGMIYGAAFSWNSNLLPFEEMNKQISMLEYQDNTETFLTIIHEISSQDESLWGNIVEYKEGFEKSFTKECIDHAVQANPEVEASILKLYAVIGNMDRSRRGVVKAYIIMAKGILLLHTLQATIGKYKYNINNTLAANPSKLAVDLEYWLKDYKELWRSIDKEAELYRIQNVIFWYADLLRDL